MPQRRIRIVLWDVYDTLVAARAAAPLELGRANGAIGVRAALASAGIEAIAPDGAGAIARRIGAIAGELKDSDRRTGTAWPEPDVRQIWRRVIAEACRKGWAKTGARPVDIERIASIYEALTNPVRPMPNAHAVVRSLLDAGVLQGIVSNAQFFTPPLLAAMFPSPAGPIWTAGLCVWSWIEGVAKPSPDLYARAVERVRRFGARPGETLMIGNHPINDVDAAARAGFRTAWFCSPDAIARLPRSMMAAGRTADMRVHHLGDLPRAIRRAGFRLG